MTEDTAMRDDAYSQFIREKKGLDPDWRVFLWEAVGEDKVRLTGALARPSTKHEEGPEGYPVWIRPMKQRRQMTIKKADYRNLSERDIASRKEGAA